MLSLAIAGWFASGFQVTGIVLNAFKIKWCWICNLISNCFWLYYGYNLPKEASLPFIVLTFLFMVLNIFGFIKWTWWDPKQQERKRWNIGRPHYSETRN